MPPRIEPGWRERTESRVARGVNAIRLRARKRLISPLCKRLMRDDDPDLRRCILIAGAPRSGTTWLGELLEQSLNARLMFEPFHPLEVPQFAEFRLFHYAAPDYEDERLEHALHMVFSGRLRNEWIDKNATRLRPKYRVVKSIRANLMLAWIRHRFPDVRVITLLRHPCAVVLSRMHYGWNAEGDIAAFLAQGSLMREHLGPFEDVIRRARTAEEKHAVVWCVNTVVPISQLGLDALQPTFYEYLYTDPDAELRALAQRLQLPIRAPDTRALTRPSRTTTAGSPVMMGHDNLHHWGRALSVSAIERIMCVVDAFGLGMIYKNAPMPAVRARGEAEQAREATCWRV